MANLNCVNSKSDPQLVGPTFDQTSNRMDRKRSKHTKMETVRSVMTIVAHLLIGTIVGVSLIFACRNGIALSPTSQHIVLCVIGYQLLMGEAVLCLAPNSWLSTLSLKSRRRVHWVLQIVGSILAITGSTIKSIHKSTKGINYNTVHGQFGLASMIFTSASLLNGVASLYAYELRRILPDSLSKTSHICCGIIAYGTASTCLIYGFDKTSFRSWASSHLTDVLVVMTGGLTVIIIVNPLINFYQKCARVIKF